VIDGRVLSGLAGSDPRVSSQARADAELLGSFARAQLALEVLKLGEPPAEVGAAAYAAIVRALTP
jgi:hypothetical protein